MCWSVYTLEHMPAKDGIYDHTIILLRFSVWWFLNIQTPSRTTEHAPVPFILWATLERDATIGRLKWVLAPHFRLIYVWCSKSESQAQRRYGAIGYAFVMAAWWPLFRLCVCVCSSVCRTRRRNSCARWDKRTAWDNIGLSHFLSGSTDA